MTRFVIGRRLVEVDVGQFAELVARHDRVTIDVGTGDGRAVLATAVRDPRTLTLGMDANAAAMAESSRRAAAARGGLPNAAFVVAAAECPPAELLGIADEVTVRFPWASLLRGCVGRDPIVAGGLASLVRAGGTLELLLAPSVRDGLDGVPVDSAVIARAAVDAFAASSLEAAVARPATDAEITASGSTWAKRLRSQHPDDRPVMLVRLVRPT